MTLTDRNDDKKMIDDIQAIKKNLGKELLILTHHYQRKEIVALGDYQASSYPPRRPFPFGDMNILQRAPYLISRH